MKHHQNESSPQRPHPCSHRFYWILQKAAVCRIDEPRQVECLISPVIIMMLLIDTGLSPTAASPGETFDPCSLSPGGASVYLPSPSPGRKTNTQDRFWARVCWAVPPPPHCPFATCMNCIFVVTDRHLPRHTASFCIDLFFLCLLGAPCLPSNVILISKCIYRDLKMATDS